MGGNCKEQLLSCLISFFWPLVDKLRAQMMKKGNMTPDNWLRQCVDAEKAYRELVVAERENCSALGVFLQYVASKESRVVENDH